MAVAPPGVLDDVLERFRAREVHGRLDLGRPAADAAGGDAGRDGRPPGGAPQRLLQPLVGEQGGIHAARDQPHLVDRLLDAPAELEQGRGLARHDAPQALGGQLELDAQADEPLLGAVVEVALDAPRSRSATATTRARDSARSSSDERRSVTSRSFSSTISA